MEKKIRVFYDGTCGLCHYFVHFSLVRMKHSNPFYFSPLQGTTFKKITKKCPYQAFPDSIVVYDGNEKRLLVKSEAVVKILGLLGQPWRSFAFLLRGIPLLISNRIYDFIAKIRHKLFKKPKQTCPIIRQEWKKYFED